MIVFSYLQKLIFLADIVYLRVGFAISGPLNVSQYFWVTWKQ